MENKQKKGLVPYDMVSPGFEAMYTGEKSSSPVEKTEIITTLTTDKAGNIIRKWSVFPWTWPGQEKDWDDNIKYINKMQLKLGHLDENFRQIRAHIASLVPCDSGFPVTVDELLNAIGRGKLAEPSFRIIEGWIHGIGTGKLAIQTRKAGTERERLGHLLFGYVLGLDKWLLGLPMQFFILDLGHINLGFDPKNEILRVYAYLGEDRTPVKEWLAACLWNNLTYNPIGGNPGGLVRHKDLLDLAAQVGISVREWMDSAKKH